MPEELTLNAPASSAGELTESAAPATQESGATLESPAPEVSAPTGETPAANGEAPGTDDLPPFHEHPRWQEVQTQLQAIRAENERLKAWEPVLEQFKAAGLAAPDAVQAAVAERNEQAALQQIAATVWQEVTGGKDLEDCEQWELDLAEERFQRIQIERQWEQSQQATQRQTAQQVQVKRTAEVAAQLPALIRLYPQMDESDVRKAALSDPAASLDALAKASHDKTMQIIASYNARTAQRPQVPVEGAGGSPSSSGKSVADMPPDEFKQWWDAQLARAEAARP